MEEVNPKLQLFLKLFFCKKKLNVQLCVGYPLAAISSKLRILAYKDKKQDATIWCLYPILKVARADRLGKGT